MNILIKTLAVTAIIGLAGCANNSRFDDSSAIPGDMTGSLNDPTSPAYFQNSVGDRIFFAVDQSTLGTDAKSTLRMQADWLNSNTAYNAIIEGHADEQGTREYNLALGARRASAVRDYLVSLGIPDSRLRTVSYGKERPIEICSDESCYARNRRAVTVISADLNG